MVYFTSVLLHQYQFGFRNNHSTYLALSCLMDKIISSLNDGDYVLGFLGGFYFSKASDTIYYNILFDKLEFYGVRGNVHCWLQSYLIDRCQYVEYNGATSSWKNIMWSSTGIYTRPSSSSWLYKWPFFVYQEPFPLMFADGTTIYIQGKDMSQIQNDMNEEMIKISA